MPESETRILLSSREEVFRRNPRVNVETVAAHDRLERELRALGVEIKPSYNIGLPLGRTRGRFHICNC